MELEELTGYSAAKLGRLIKAGQVSPVEVVAAFLRRIEQVNPALNAIVTLSPDALQQARAAEVALTHGDDIGPLHGVPLTIKDTIETGGLRTTYGSRLYADFVPARDAPVVARLKKAGAIILGKTNTPEMAIPYETDNPVFGRTNNPHDSSRTPGGSSGGEAAAIAARLSPAGIGSDLSGSIRVPAHFCGVAGLKPTTGRVPMDGHVPHAAGGLEHGACIGPMARRVEDLSLLFNVISDSGSSGSTKSGAAVGLSSGNETSSLSGLRICWYADDGFVPVTAETASAVKSVAAIVKGAGAEAFEGIPPGVVEGGPLWIMMFARAANDQLRQIYRGHEDQAGPAVQALLAESSSAPDGPQRADLAKRDRLRGDLLEWMKETPIIIAPVASTPAFAHNTKRVDIDGTSISVFRACSYSQTYNVFDLPAVTVPVLRSTAGLPIGVQIVGRPFAEELVLKVAAIVERELG